MGLARGMAGAGHDVRIATSEELCPVVTSLGLTAVTAGMGDGALVAEARRRWPETEQEPPARWALRMFTDIAAPAMAADLTRLIEAWKPDVVVREEGEYGAPVAAAVTGTTCVTHGWGSPLRPAAALEDLAGRVAPLWGAAGLAAPRGEDLHGAAVLDPCPPSLYGADRPASLTQQIRPAPAALPRAFLAEALQPAPLAYVGFGTVPLYRDRPELIAAVVQALLRAGFAALVTTPDAQLARRLRALDPERVRVEEWASLPQVLASCELVVSHSGAGTVLAALGAGVPLLLLPGGAPSQLRMSLACARRGAARLLDPDGIEGVHLDDALDDLVSQGGFRAAAQELAAEIAGMPPAAEAVRVIEDLVNDGVPAAGRAVH